MSITPVAVDSVVWFSLADRAGAVDSSIRVSERRSLAGWLSLCLGLTQRREILRLVLGQSLATGFVCGAVRLLFVGALPMSSPGLVQFRVWLLVGSCLLVQLHGVVGY